LGEEWDAGRKDTKSQRTLKRRPLNHSVRERVVPPQSREEPAERKDRQLRIRTQTSRRKRTLKGNFTFSDKLGGELERNESHERRETTAGRRPPKKEKKDKKHRKLVGLSRLL